jgi:mono/diheme cytochrome c family protein
MYRRLVMIALSVSVCAIMWTPALAQTAAPAPAATEAQTAAPAATEATAEPPHDPPPAIDPAMLKDAAMVAKGEKIWQDQCTHCHGAKAYPGKAPKLTPRTYKPEFVWDRVHNGFRGMPPWKDIYEPNEVLALVAYVLSDDFFP